MIRSMTGFGAASTSENGVTVSVEVRSLNNRFLDTRLRLPRQLEAMEEAVNRRLRRVCERGSISLTLSLEQSKGSANGAVTLDRERFESYKDLAEQIADEYDCHLKLTDLVDVRGLLIASESTEISERTIMGVLEQALDQLREMRAKEGEALGSDIQSRVAIMGEILEKISHCSEDISKNLSNDYMERIQALLTDASVDEGRIATEAALLAEKGDITEECVRCASHLEQIGSLVEGDGPAGKRLSFLLQEVVREINTIGSKSSDLSITNHVIDLKEEAERIKEQVQNVL